MIRMNIIEPVKSEWSWIIVFDPKRDCSTRIFIDYIKLNYMKVMEVYQIPGMYKCPARRDEARIL